MLNYDDGKPHTLGPLTFHSHSGSAHLRIKTEGATSYLLDFHYAKALAEAIAVVSEILTAKENDKEPNSRTQTPRGDLRLVVSSDKKKWGSKLVGDKNENYPIGRIIMDAKKGEAVASVDLSEAAQRDYRRAALEKKGGSGRADTRTAFIETGICSRVEALQGKEAAEVVRQRLTRLFAEADAIHAPLPVSTPATAKGD